MEVQAWLKAYQKAVHPVWQQFFLASQAQAQKAGWLPQELLAKFIDLYPRGKQARGALAVLGYELAGGQDKPRMLQASITLELMETAVLIADDVFDDDLVRRGVPTIHKQWEKTVARSQLSESGRQKLGQDLAHITSIIGFHLAPLATLSAGLPDAATRKALTFYCQSSVTTGFGEALDISAPVLSFQEKQASTQLIHDMKTVRYSTVLPLQFGALLAGRKSAGWLKTLEKYALCLGRIFQIQDDIIGSFGDPAKTGKSNESDIRGTRWTVLIELLWQRLSSQDKKHLRTIFEKRERSDRDVRQVKQWFKQYQIRKLAQTKAQRFGRQGEVMIPRLTSNRKRQGLLKQLLHFMLEREK